MVADVLLRLLLHPEPVGSRLFSPLLTPSFIASTLFRKVCSVLPGVEMAVEGLVTLHPESVSSAPALTVEALVAGKANRLGGGQLKLGALLACFAASTVTDSRLLSNDFKDET
mmetsp:Transcript_19116/g.52681  ORF Transcript_19116/g.52681 Transcript_19116/m.52681 type:complete len:113 (+) Transcript_19116:1139-1477(+)